MGSLYVTLVIEEPLLAFLRLPKRELPDEVAVGVAEPAPPTKVVNTSSGNSSMKLSASLKLIFLSDIGVRLVNQVLVMKLVVVPSWNL